MRSVLFVPAVRPRFIEKAPTVGADVVCIDMEDAVAPADKPRAREMVREAVPGMPRTGYVLWVRVNGLDTGLLEEDLDAVVSPHIDGIELPKAHTPEIVRQADAYLTFLEKLRGIPHNQIKLMLWIESARAVSNPIPVLEASPRVIAASIGGEDFTADMGIKRTGLGKEIEWARYAVATACRAANVHALDTPQPDFRDLDLLRRDAAFARSIGFRGKHCIHPDQVATVNEVFAPAPEDIAWARRVVEAYTEGESRGLGAVAVDGVMIDRPIYVRALQVLDQAPNA